MRTATTTARQQDPTSIRTDDLLSAVRSLYAELHRASGDLADLVNAVAFASQPAAMPGKASATTRLFKDGWLDSGDRGYLAGGELYITGRVKDIIIRRGRHIYPDEIEQAVGEIEGVRKDCIAAFGANEPATATEKLVVLAETHYTDPTLLAQLKSRINQRVVDTVGEPPEEILLAPPHTVLKTSSGKLRRAATRTAYEDGSLQRAPSRPAVQMLRLAIESIGPALRRVAQAGTHIAYGCYAWFAVVAFWSAVVAFWSAVGLIGLMLPRPEQIWRLNHRAARWLISALRIPFSVSWETSSNLTAPHVIVTNHCSYVDSIFVAAVLPSPHLFVANAELQRAPVLGAWLRRIGTLFIERFEPVQSVSEVARLKQVLAQGNSIVMFPEGTFTRH
jgi:1-acyl-sn-glycerol-3-phosphate acyltransferase